MRACFLLCLACLLFLTRTLNPLRAEEPKNSPATRIESDQKTEEIRFFVGGELAAVLNEHGLTVRNDIRYEGIIEDRSRHVAPPATTVTTEQ